MDFQSKPPIRRKPVATPTPNNRPSDSSNTASNAVLSPIIHDLIYDNDPPPYEEAAQQRPQLPPRYTTPALPPRPTQAATFSPSPPQPTSNFTSFSRLSSPLTTSRSSPNLRAAFNDPSPPPPLPTHEQPTTPLWESALAETRAFASSLIPHPAESTRHFSILRHSPPLIIYRGATTSVAVTIFSSPTHPLPATRRLLLQRRGYSGHAGLKLRAAVGADKGWIDVSPERRAEPGRVVAADEKAWGRDIARFLAKRATEVREDEERVARETCVVRIPEAAADGYFLLVLCSSSAPPAPSASTPGASTKAPKFKILCHSPVFRIASTSMDPAVLRGAPVAALPLELALKAASTVGRTVAARAVGPAALAAQAPLNRIKSAVAVKRASNAIVKTGARGVVSGLEGRYKNDRARRDEAYGGQDNASALTDEVEVVGPDEGPSKPFPITFSGQVRRGTGRAGMEVGIPTANLSDVPDDVKQRLRGTYFGWACIPPSSQSGKSSAEGMSHGWHASIISIGPSAYAAPTTVAKNIVTAHLLHDFGTAMFLDAKMKVIVMGRLRDTSAPSASIQERLDQATRDSFVAVSSLARENWGPDMTLERIKTEKSARTFTDRYIDIRDMAQKQVDRIPLHLAGVRTTGRDQIIGAGGYWIARG